MSDPIARLTNALSKLPGIGEKTAARLTFFILKQPKEYATELATALLEVKERVGLCSVCFDLSEGDPCRRCRDPHRDPSQICVIATPQDLIAVERTGSFRGKYHVLGGVLSPLEGVGPNELKIRELLGRLNNEECKEIILATPPTVEGDATALYLAKLIKPIGLRVTRLAMGLPVGGELEYADQVTLSRAFEGRRDL